MEIQLISIAWRGVLAHRAVTEDHIRSYLPINVIDLNVISACNIAVVLAGLVSFIEHIMSLQGYILESTTRFSGINIHAACI